MIHVICSYNNLNGLASIEDYVDAKSGVNPSGMVTVDFYSFKQAVPVSTLSPLTVSSLQPV